MAADHTLDELAALAQILRPCVIPPLLHGPRLEVDDLDVSASAVGDRLNRPGLVRIRERYEEVDVLVVAKPAS